MNDTQFILAINKILNEVEDERRQKVHQRIRAEVLGRIRGVFLLLLIATFIVFAFNYHEWRNDEVAAKPSAPANGATAAALSGVVQNLQTRDAEIANLAK